MSGWLDMDSFRLAKLDIGIPFVVLHVRCLLPGTKDAPFRLRSQVLKQAFPARPRWQWYLLLLGQIMIWFSFMAWWRLYQVIRYCPLAATSEDGPALHRQLTDLLYLALVCGIDPYSYYEFRLHDWPRKHWMEFVFPQETMNWHSVLSCKPGSPSVALLRNKQAFSEYLAAKGISSVATLRYLPKGKKVVLTELLRNESLFLKPNEGNAMRGCAELIYSDPQGSYRLHSANPREEFDTGSSEEIEKIVNRLVACESYIVQPLLLNSNEIEAMFTTDDLVTLRIISAWIDGTPSIVNATAEVRTANDGWIFLPLNLQTGNLLRIQTLQPDNWSKDIPGKGQVTIPRWSETCSLVVRAHAELKDLLTVAWDLAITDDGPIIIEGNTSWNIEAMQTSSGTPALRTDLLKAYESAVETGTSNRLAD